MPKASRTRCASISSPFDQLVGATSRPQRRAWRLWEGRVIGRSRPGRACPVVFAVERTTGIEPAFSAWEADVLPLNYIRLTRRFTLQCVSSHPARDLRMTYGLSKQPA